MKLITFGLIFVIFFIPLESFSQDTQNTNQLNPSTTDLIILFSVIIIAVIGIILYTSREIILRKKSEYDEKDLASKRDRDYEKYHSEWTDDSYEFGRFDKKKFNKEFQKALEESTLPDCYKILGVTKDASSKEIKIKYRELAKKMHPDRNKDEKSKEKMAELNMAYEILSDEDKRAQYDKYSDVL